LPFISVFVRRVGGVPASPHNGARLLEQDELVMAFPEGVKGTGKQFSERYRLQRFGRGGFVEVALRTGSPIVPVAVVGSEEIYPKLADARPLARAVGAPFVPITPTFPALGPLGLIPLPSKWRFEFPDLPLVLSLAATDEGKHHLSWRFSEDVKWKPKLTLRMDSKVANAYLQGRESLAIAMARGRVKATGDTRSALVYIPALKL